MIRGALQRRLESEAPSSPLVTRASTFWERVANPVRPVRLPRGAAVVGIGGATLGGGGKTPVTLELARALRGAGATVAVVASGYHARGTVARVVQPDDDVAQVGDEALYLARQLAPLGVTTVVGPRRETALELAARYGRIVLADALLQTRAERLSCAILVLDAAAPWGSGCCPPAGDLRAARRKLLGASDVVVVCHDPAQRQPPPELGVPALWAESSLAGARGPDGRLHSLESLRMARLGLVLAIARPMRVQSALAARSVVPAVVEIFPDHATPRPRPRPGPRIEAWLTTGKCATKLGQYYAGAPVFPLDHRLVIPAELVRHLYDAAQSPW